LHDDVVGGELLLYNNHSALVLFKFEVLPFVKRILKIAIVSSCYLDSYVIHDLFAVIDRVSLPVIKVLGLLLEEAVSEDVALLHLLLCLISL